MKKAIIAIIVVAIAAICGIGAGYYFSHQNAAPQQTATAQAGGTTSQQGAAIDETEAQQIALEDAGLTEADVSFTQTHLDRDDGRRIYDVEFIVTADNSKVDYEIDADSGAILSVDREQGRDTSAASQQAGAGEITADEAKAIALQHAGLTEADVLYIDVEYDRDDGRSEWAIDFTTEASEYDYEIAAADGSILKSENEARGR